MGVTTCRWTTGRLPGYAEGTLPAREATRCAAHLARCPACRQVLEELRRLPEVLRVWEPAPASLPEGMAAAAWIMSRADDRVAPEPRWRPAWWPALAAAGAVAALLIVGTQLRGKPGPERTLAIAKNATPQSHPIIPAPTGIGKPERRAESGRLEPGPTRVAGLHGRVEPARRAPRRSGGARRPPVAPPAASAPAVRDRVTERLDGDVLLVRRERSETEGDVAEIRLLSDDTESGYREMVITGPASVQFEERRLGP